MRERTPQIERVRLEKIVGEGKALATTADGRKLFVWGGLPGEDVSVRITKKKSKLLEGFVEEVHEASPERIEPKDPGSFLSTSPWQIIDIDTENRYKAQLVAEAYALHATTLPGEPMIWSDGRDYGYRNKVEFSFWWDRDTGSLDLAFFRRGSHQKVEVEGTALALPAINEAGRRMRDILRAREDLNGMELKTFLVRATQDGQVSGQLYVKSADFPHLTEEELQQLNIASFELIFSNPKSPASVITERLQQHGATWLEDTILGVPFRYATEGFFQINLPVYEQALKDMQRFIPENTPVVDLYSGVGSIGLTVGGEHVTLVELNEHAVREMEQNIVTLQKTKAKAVLAASESALEYIDAQSTLIVDPPRAGLHDAVTERILNVQPERIIYLSCNPSTQARDVAKLLTAYDIIFHTGYNFFPHTPHIEYLVVLNKR